MHYITGKWADLTVLIKLFMSNSTSIIFLISIRNLETFVYFV